MNNTTQALKEPDTPWTAQHNKDIVPRHWRIEGTLVFYNDEVVAHIFQKHGLYEYLSEHGVDWKKYLSKKLLPDNCIYVIVNNCN